MASKFVRVTNFVAKKCLLRPSNYIKPLSTRCYGSVPEITQVDELLYEDFVTKLQQQPETIVTTLENGLRVATETTSTATATVGLWVDTGSRYETPETNGVAHFLEHLIFKGTDKRAQTDLELEVENMGAQLNAYTSREQTVFYIKCLANDVSKGIDILSDITQNSKLSEEAIERERGVIMREMEEVERNMQEIVFDYLHACAFQRTPLGMTILGPSENIQRFTRNDIAKYIEEHYEPQRMVLAGAGGVSHDSLVKLAEKHFGHLKNTDKNYRPEAIPKFTGSQALYNDDAMPLAHVALAVEGAAWDNPDNIPLMLANTIIGNYDRSMAGGKLLPGRLQTAFAERPGCHSFQSFNTCYNDTGLWGIYMVCEHEKMWEAVELAQDTWMRMTSYISEDEMKRAKNLLATNLMLSLDGTTPICEDIGRQMLCYGRRIPQLEMQMRILNTSRMEVASVLHEYLYDREIAVSGVGPVSGHVSGLPDYARMQSNMRSLKK